MSPTKKSPVRQEYPPLGTSSHAVAWVSLDKWVGGVLDGDAQSNVHMLAVLRYALHRAGEDHPDVQGSAASIRQEWDLAVGRGVDIPGERDRRYGPPPMALCAQPPKRSGDGV